MQEEQKVIKKPDFEDDSKSEVEEIYSESKLSQREYTGVGK